MCKSSEHCRRFIKWDAGDVELEQVFSSCLRSSGRTGIIASEEEDTPVAVEESYSGNYIVVFDPLDGSSNIDAAVSTGSIFGIYKPNEECLTDLGENPTVKRLISLPLPGPQTELTIALESSPHSITESKLDTLGPCRRSMR